MFSITENSGNSDKSGSMKPAEVAGIVIACLFVFTMICFVIFYFGRRVNINPKQDEVDSCASYGTPLTPALYPDEDMRNVYA